MAEVIECQYLHEWTKNIEQANTSKKLVVIDFTASWCGPCRTIAPVFQEFAKKFPGIVFLKVDVDRLPPIAEQFGVQAMPTFIFMKEGEVKETVVGAVKDELHKKLVQHAGASSN